ncbi:MAG TPA: ABC transporter permease [Gaiellaceae bacterium]|nr:ABC transporter permease [Gaiellaceae bacterium]
MTGADYVLKRTLFALMTVFVAVTLNFVLFRAAPGDATSSLRSCRNCTPEFREALHRELGLDKPKLEQYGIYLKDLAQGDLGLSFVTRQPVWDELRQPILNTLPMVGLGYLIAMVLGVLVGVLAAWRRGTFLDWGGVSTSLFFYSMPQQWFGLMLLILFAGTLPASGIADPFIEFTDPSWWTVVLDRLEHMILPSTTLGLVLYGQYALIVRSSMLEALGEDYIMTARAKGLSSFAIVRKHALRTSLLPIVTLAAITLGFVIGGDILVEAVFSYPGIGLATYEAVFDRDYPVLQGAFLLLTLSVIVANFVADLLYFKFDPRITG